jgi:predicted DNA-binding protein YlxM (UPF0122 family)
MTEILQPIDRTANLILLDLYGALLTERTRDILDLYLSEDLSLTEIAENLAISRQGVHDAISRGLVALNDFEDRLALMAKRQQAQRLLDQAVDEVKTGFPENAINHLLILSELL